MAFNIHLDPQAREDLKPMRGFERAAILDTIERVLTQSPTITSRTRIKRLRKIESPEYRLRVGEFRVFYDVEEQEVYVLRILAKSEADQFLKEMGHEA
jgi:mRNA-degrading endonuclease RelE of RelBE toxin-antitoxin system